MPRRVQILPACCPSRRAWPRVVATTVGVLLAGCASPHARSPGSPSQTQHKHVLPAAVTASQSGALRIAQQRTAAEPVFLLVANDPPPTPKTLAVGGPLVATRAAAAPGIAAQVPSVTRAIEPTRAPRSGSSRVREPVGSIYFPSAGTQVRAPGLAIVAAAAHRAGRTDRLVLTAYTDPYGPLELNRRLADHRAESVVTALTARGVDPARLITLSRPQCCIERSLAERDAAPYRRVDIELLTHRRTVQELRSHGDPLPS